MLAAGRGGGAIPLWDGKAGIRAASVIAAFLRDGQSSGSGVDQKGAGRADDLAVEV
jgi:hypothetical protein